MNYIIFLLFVILTQSQIISIKEPIDEIKLRRQFKIDAIVQTNKLELTQNHKKNGLLQTTKQLPKDFIIKGEIQSEAVGTGFALWLSKDELFTGNIYGGRINVNDQNKFDNLGLYLKVATEKYGDVVSLNKINDNVQINHCKFTLQANKTKMGFNLSYEDSKKKLSIEITTDNEQCKIEANYDLPNSVFFGLSAIDDKSVGNHQLTSLEIVDPKKTSKSVNEILQSGEENERLHYEFIESELFGNSDDIEHALQKLYTVIGRVYDQAMKLDTLNTENDRLIKILKNGVQHLNEMLKNQELVIDTNDIQFDIQTFKHRLSAIEKLTGMTLNDLNHVLGINSNTNEKIMKRNEQSNHPFFWFSFFILQVITMMLLFNLLRIKLWKKERREL